MSSSRQRVIPPWLHVCFWIASAALAMMTAVTGLAALYAAGARIPSPDPNNTTYLVSFATALAVLLVIWRRYWFLRTDLAALLEARGARIESTHPKRTLCARVGEVWVLTALDRPLRGYWPGRLFQVARGGLVPMYGLKPDYMFRAAQIELVRPGDFSRVPAAPIETTARALAGEAVRSGVQAFDDALRAAAAEVRDADMPISIEIGDRELRIRTVGGSWMGTRFGLRIEDLFSFTNRLLECLAGLYTPSDVDAWTREWASREQQRLLQFRNAALRARR
jgi:hypothetical protein